MSATSRRRSASRAAGADGPALRAPRDRARSLANTIGGRHQNSSTSGRINERCRVRMPRLPMLANATPKVTMQSSANTT